MTDTPTGNLNTIAQARQRLGGIGVSTLYDWIRAGHIRVLKIGSRSFISDAEIARVIHEAEALATQKAASRQTREVA